MGRITTKVLALGSLVFASAAVLAQHPDFSGNWRLNEKLSQDRFEKIYSAVGPEQVHGAGTAAYDATFNANLLRDTDRDTALRTLLDYARVLEVVEIEHNENEIQISVGEGAEFFSLFYLDGEKHARELPPDGLRIEATAKWEGDAILVDQVGENNAVLKEVFSSAGNDRLAILFHLRSRLTEVPVMFRVVYDRVQSE